MCVAPVCGVRHGGVVAGLAEVCGVAKGAVAAFLEGAFAVCFGPYFEIEVGGGIFLFVTGGAVFFFVAVGAYGALGGCFGL